jgi:hypothetical protein
MRSLPRLAAVLALTTLSAAPASAWFTVGHAKIARASVRALPPSVPHFFRDGAFAVGEAAVDPDLLKDATQPALKAAEDPQHFLDSELLEGAALPADRWAFVAMATERHLDPKTLGILPYSVLESVQRLTITFAEHRAYPRNVEIQRKALVYAGWLAHYAADLEQPLHTTLHHDGRALPDGKSPRTGIHQLVDGLFERVPLDDETLLRGLPVHAFPDSWKAIQDELAASHALVDRCYELEPDLRAAFPPPPPAPAPGVAAPAPPPVQPQPISPAVSSFTTERYRATATFLASLYLTAWEQSAAVKLPKWLERPNPPRWWQR